MGVPKGYRVKSSGTGTAFGLADMTGGIPAGSQHVILQAETQAIRWRDDGTDPTATVGMLLAAGDVMDYDGKLQAIKFIAAVAGAILHASYYSTSKSTLLPEGVEPTDASEDAIP
jgi:hypothetical protein